ncbi:MAG TPA: PKD domain-containing protein, partial [Candidatus Thermoplasmatota archaeon]|nr:PKD domain-containing protein [Candidatus Thermoplasmatota archaeon]
MINNEDILASPDPEDIAFDYQLIFDTTQYLSWRINNSYNNTEQAKGRDFGSKGEHDAAYYISNIMTNLNLYDPDVDPNCNISYLQQIKDAWENITFLNITIPQSVTNDLLEINNKKLTLHNFSANGTANEFIDIPECYISAEYGNASFKSFLQKNPNYDYNNLTKNFTCSDLHIKPLPLLTYTFIDKFLNDTLTQIFFNESIQNKTRSNENIFDENLTGLFEKYYNFTFEDLLENPENATTLPWYNETCYNNNYNCIYLDEFTNFNPNYSSIPSLDAWIQFILKVLKNDSYGINIDNSAFTLLPVFQKLIRPFRQNIITRLFYIYHLRHPEFYKAFMVYDYHNDCYNLPGTDYAIPIVYVNKTLGKQLEENSDDYRINISLDQSWNENVESYNVIGQINGSDPDPNKTILIQCLYDSAWCSGTADSAIGVSMVLALAKFMKQLEQEGIKPKYNVRFILFGGEERGCRGAIYYEMTLPQDHTVKTVIDLNQLGFEQRDPSIPLIMNVATNHIRLKPLLEHITNTTSYEERKNDSTEFRLTWTPDGSVSDEFAFANWLTGTPLKTNTVMFLKDFNWTRHHRDGENHTKGDTMDYYDQEEIPLLMEMIWNVTRAFAMNPNCWLENEPQYFYTNCDDQNNIPDAVNVSFAIKTVLPEDKVTVRLILIPTYPSHPLHPGYPILYRYRTEKEFIVTPDGTNGYIQLQLPKGAPAALYRIHLVLLNSTGDAYVDLFGRDGVLSQAFETIDDVFEFFEDECDIDCETAFLDNAEEIKTDFNLDITDFLDRHPRLRDIQDFIQDLLAIWRLQNDRDADLQVLSPPNNPPEPPAKPEGPAEVYAHQKYDYTTRTTDPDNDQVEYKWRFHLGDLLFNYNKWSYPPSDSGDDHTQSNIWDSTGKRWVYVKARDIWHSHNILSDYSKPLEVNVKSSSWFDAPCEALVGETVQFNGYLYGAEMNQIQWDMGLSKGWQNKSENNPTETYTEEGNYNITVNVTDEPENMYLFTKDIEIKYIISNFTGSSGNTNQTLWFNDTSRLYENYRITNWTWDFDDGTIIYGEHNIDHKFLSPGVYNVTLTVTDEDHDSIDICSQTCYIENDEPVILDVTSKPLITAPDEKVMLYADAIDSISGIKTITLNITLPDSSWQIIAMEPTTESELDEYSYDYTAEFTDTDQIGHYYYSITIEDNAGNNIRQGGFSFTVSELAFLPTTPYYGTVSYDDIPVDLFSSTETGQHYAFTSIAGDVILWMPMDETTTEYNPMDVSGYENDGVRQGGANQTRNGSFGKGFLFDGVDDYLEIEPNASLMFNASQPMTWSFWVCPEYSAVNTTMGVLSKASSTSNGSGFTFCLNTTIDDAAFVICAPDDGVLRYSDSVNLNIGNTSWAQLTVVYNGSFGWDVYMNGSKQDTVFFPVTSNTATSYLLGAGRNATGDAADLFFQGILDDFIMFKRGVDTNEILSLFNASEYPYSHNFTDLTDGTYNFTGCAGYPGGFANKTETRSILIDTLAPIISNVTESPDTVGFGGNVQINATVMENGSGLLLVAVNISYPNATSWNYSMTCVDDDVYQLNFSDTWFVGQYNYSVWAMDNVGNTALDSGHSFNVTANATISIATLKNSYSGTQYINITDPPNPPENLTVVDRGLTWNTYYNATSGQNILEAYQGPVNYQEENSTWIPINNTITQLPSNHPAYTYGYRTGNNQGLYGVYFKSNVQLEWPVAFTYNKSDDPSIYAVRSKLVGVGYIDPQSNWAYQYLQNVQSSQGQINDNSITFEDVFTGADVTWGYGNIGLKEEITMSNATKTVLQNHPPSQYGLNDASSYLVFITRLDYQNLNLYNNSGLLDGNVTIS